MARSIWHSACMATQLVEVGSFQMAVRDPFLEALISVLSEPNGSSTAQQAFETTRDWWDKHSDGPTVAELLDAMFEPADWLSVIEDRNRPLAGQEAQLELMRSWLLLYWCRLGAISFVAGVDLVVRPGAAVLLSGAAKPLNELGLSNSPLDN